MESKTPTRVLVTEEEKEYNKAFIHENMGNGLRLSVTRTWGNRSLPL